MNRHPLAPIVLAAVVVLSACSAAGGAGAPGALPQAAKTSGTTPVGTYIKHVVIIVQENRSFENLFAGYPGANAPLYGYSSAKPNVKIPLAPIGFLKKDMYHTFNDALTDYDNGKMDGFESNVLVSNGQPAGTYPYSYVNHNLIEPYWALARQYVLADHMFTTMFGQSYTSHLDLISGTTNLTSKIAVANDPEGGNGIWGCDDTGALVDVVNQDKVIDPPGYSNGVPPCFDQFNTLGQVLDTAHVSWKYYEPQVASTLWSAYDSIKKVRYGSDWTTNMSIPQTNVLADARNGTLPAVSWVIPDWLDSDHPAAGSRTGPAWVASVVNAIGKGPDWNSTAIFIVWDDWGSWYDNLPPPQLSFVGLGIRVPCLIVSPYAKKGYVSHTQYEFASILKFTERAFGLPVIGAPSDGYTDTRASDMLDSFDFAQAPRPFQKIPSAYPASYFTSRAPSGRVPDDN